MKSPFILGISGGSASGKTTLATKIRNRFKDQSTAILSLDNYYNNMLSNGADALEINFDHPDSLDVDLLARHLHTIKTGSQVEIPQYNFTSHTREDKTVVLKAVELLIVEGLFLFNLPKLEGLFDFKVFVEASEVVRFKRRLNRDVSERGRTPESVKKQFEDTVRPMHKKFVAPNLRLADFVFDGENFPQRMLSELIREIITSRS